MANRQAEKAHELNRIVGVVEALVYLNSEALKTNNKEIALLIDSTCNIIMTAYYLTMRNSVSKKIGAHP